MGNRGWYTTSKTGGLAFPPVWRSSGVVDVSHGDGNVVLHPPVFV